MMLSQYTLPEGRDITDRVAVGYEVHQQVPMSPTVTIRLDLPRSPEGNEVAIHRLTLPEAQRLYADLGKVLERIAVVSEALKEAER